MNPLRRRIHTAMQARGGAAAWSPASIAGLQLWLDASQIVGLNDGDAVATWSDLSGNGLNFTQATASKRPLYKTGAQNGLPGVLADGVDDIMESAVVDWSAHDKCTVFLAMKNPVAAVELFFERSPNLNVNPGGFSIVTDATVLQPAIRTTTGAIYSVVTTPTASGVVVVKIDLALTTAALTATLNGTAFGTRTWDGYGGNFGNYANFLFERSGGGVAPLNGYILEFGIYLGEIGDPARAQLTTYLRNKWGY